LSNEFWHARSIVTGSLHIGFGETLQSCDSAAPTEARGENSFAFALVQMQSDWFWRLLFIWEKEK
jgi:hypothetical protein